MTHDGSLLSNALLGAVRSERQRSQAPAVVALAQQSGGKRPRLRQLYEGCPVLRSTFNCIRSMALASIYFSDLDDTPVVLARRSHKFQEVKQELSDAGIATKDVSYLTKHCSSPNVLRVLCGSAKILRNFVMLVYLRRRLKTAERLLPYLELICTYAVVLRECAKVERRTWLVVGDLSTFQIALAAAISRAGHDLITWQYDYLDFKRFPVRPRYAVVLNETGVALARLTDLKGEQNRVYWRAGISARPLDLDRLDRGPVGVLLNAFADARIVSSLLEPIQSMLKKDLIVRKHPNSKLSDRDLPTGMRFHAQKKSLHNFVESTGIVVSGNTSAQLKVLCYGAPVVHLAGLDPMKFDHHGYVARGIIYGVLQPTDLTSDGIREFYRDGEFSSQLATMLGPQGVKRRPRIEKLVQSL